MAAFNSKLRSECLNAYWVIELEDSVKKLEVWRRHYNEDRPHSAIGHKMAGGLKQRRTSIDPNYLTKDNFIWRAKIPVK
ncbi:integrase core domain-containing protein [Ruegeria profundi]|uniref:integrase core domain-containing protein n=1 Tax=Ruegeria profundi TaxID=1685378 RepID=UPI00384ED7B0